jgi:PAS domain S-box-containing protein
MISWTSINLIKILLHAGVFFMNVHPEASNSTMPSTGFVGRFVAGLMLINLFVFVLAGWSLLQSKRQYEERAAITTRNLAQVLVQYIDGSIHKVNVVLLGAADEIEKQIAEGGINRDELNGLLNRESARLPELDGLRMADARGKIKYGKGVPPGNPKSIADRDYFARLRSDPGSGLIISKPLVSRVIGKWVIILARRVNRPDGTFAGVVYGVIPLEHFLKVFSSIDVGRQGVITFRDNELAPIVRYPEPGGIGSSIGSRKVSAMIRELVKSGRKEGPYKAVSPIDGIERTYTCRKISEYPLYITVGLSTVEYLAEWRREFSIMSSVVALFFLFTLVASQRFRQDWRRRKDAVLALVEQEKKFRTLFEDSKDTILISDPAGWIQDINQAGIELFGYTKKEIIALDPERLYCNADDRMRLWQELLITGFVKDFEVEMKRKDGSIIIVNLSVSITRDNEGKVVGHRAIARDMTERKRLEKQLMQAQKMESIGILAGGVAHDFNNLLTVIYGYGQMLHDSIPEDDELSRESVDQVLNAAERATDLTKSLLAFSRKQVIHLEPVQVETIVRDTGKLIKRIIGEDIELNMDCCDGEPSVMADAGQIQQVLMNLATNARDAMPHGGILSISTREVLVRDGSEAEYDVAMPGKYVQIAVADTGVGIPEEQLGRIFEPFFTTKDVGKGTGLGLSMIYGAVKQHNGSILVDSIPGKGTTFRILLPSFENAGSVEEMQVSIPSSDFGGTETLLVAEDEDLVRAFMQKILDRAGYKVIAAADGEDAVDKFRENSEEISLILSDVVMPRKNGREIIEEARKIKPAIRSIFISGYTSNVMHAKGIFEEGMDFIAKPFVKETLLRKVREILDAG